VVQPPISYLSKDKLAAIFSHQVAAWFPDVFGNFIGEKLQNWQKTQQPLELEKK